MNEAERIGQTVRDLEKMVKPVNPRDWAAIPKQTFLVEEGKTGDCWRCCIAALLGLPAEQVPHFLEQGIAEKRDMDCLTQEWLNARGLCLVVIWGGTSSVSFPRYWAEKDDVPWPAIISAGPTPRSKAMGQHHAVVTLHNKVVYDPHPSNAGLTAITCQYLILPLGNPKQ